MPEEPRHDFFNREEDAVTSPKNDENRKRVRAKAKQHAVTLIVGKEISLTEVPDYLSLALVGRSYGKTVGEDAL